MKKKLSEREFTIRLWNLFLIIICSATLGAGLTVYNPVFAWALASLCVIIGLFWLSETESWKKFKEK